MSPMQPSSWLVFAAALLPQLFAASSSADTCGNILLQSHQVVTSLNAEEPLDAEEDVGITAPQAASWLGRGRWVAREDFWHMQGAHGVSLFARHMPGSCFRDARCRHAHSFKSEHFNSSETWSNFYSSSFGLGISGGYSGLSASVDSSMGSSTGNSGHASKRLSYASKTWQQRCYRLIRDHHCAYNKSNLQPAFLERIAALPRDGDFNANNMEKWKVSFIQRFGTHVAVASSHGALIQSLSSVDSRSDKSSACLDTSMCLKFGWMTAGNVGLKMCSKTSQCDNSTSTSKTERSTCVALGGDPKLQHKVCSADVSEQTLDSWFQGGDLESGGSAYRLSFVPMWEFLTNVDFAEYYEAAQMLRKAVEYSNCRMQANPRIEVWDGSACRCVRQCANGGSLDPSTCTCKCRGNAKHGFKGPDCTETYGTCQPGVNTGNPDAARRCPESGSCSSWYDSHQCKATEVCCATSFGTSCCPFGSTCSCGANSCRCVAPKNMTV